MCDWFGGGGYFFLVPRRPSGEGGVSFRLVAMISKMDAFYFILCSARGMAFFNTRQVDLHGRQVDLHGITHAEK